MTARKTPKVVHDAVMVPHTGLTPCCAQDPRDLSKDGFSEDHGQVNCPGASEPKEATE